MKIRHKFTLLAVVLCIFNTIAVVGLLTYMISTSFMDMEHRLAILDMTRVQKAMEREIVALKVLTEDWAFWDDSWNFANGNYPEFVEVNLPGTFENAELAFLVMYNRQGQRIILESNPEYDAIADKSFFPEQIAPSSLGAFSHKHCGFIKTDQGLALVHCSPILKSDGSGTINGYLLMARRIDTALLKRISEQTGVLFASLPLNEAPQQLVSPPSTGPAFTVEPDSAEHIMYGYQIFNESNGDPVLLIRSETDRVLYQAGLGAITGIVTLAIIIGIIILAVVYCFCSFWISRPLLTLEQSVNKVTLSPQLLIEEEPFHSLVRRKDEIGAMGFVLNSMHDRLQASYKLVDEMNQQLESKVQARTAALTSANQRLALFSKIMEGTSEGVIVTDLDGTIVEVNESMCRISGYIRSELVHQKPRILKSDRHKDDFYAVMWNQLLATGAWSGEVWNRRPGGEVYPTWLSINTIVDDDGLAKYYVALSADISIVKKSEDKLQQLAYYDQLTGLPNRTLFADRLNIALSHCRRESTKGALLFIDLDRFKNINDSLGHTVGDNLLVQVAERIRKRLRDTDTVCRIGGDEFTIILENIHDDLVAGRIAAEINELLSRQFVIDGGEMYIGASIGIALFPKDGDEAETLLKKADTAMYVAKEAGRGTYRYSSNIENEASRARLDTEIQLRRALERDELQLYYQPQNLTSLAEKNSPQGMIAAEALMRWIPPGRQPISPGVFISIAEESGMIVEMGKWAIFEACREACRWRAAGQDIQVAVNVSAWQFMDDQLPEVVSAALEETGLPPNLLKLEVTESAFLRNMEMVVSKMEQIRKWGVTFAIDDFGTGYSSLQYLKQLPIDCLKIDRAFVSGIAEDLADGRIVTAVIAMAHAFGLKAIAEGVETKAQLTALQKFDCDIIQGYLVSKPMPADDFLAFLQTKVSMDSKGSHVG